jgi:hypothetical protein
VQQRVDVADLEAGTEVVSQVVMMRRPEFGLAGIQPPDPDAVFVVAIPDLGPDVLPGRGFVAS